MTKATQSADSSNKKPYEHEIGSLDVYESYKKSPYLSLKHSSYFQVYADLLDQYRNKQITFVEVGVANGGSLFMWRDYFGINARIIGIDFNPNAKKFEKDGFEIYIGSQADPDFWEIFFKSVGPVDIVLDDGGHTFEQQIVTVHNCIPNINQGGIIIVEDTHTSYAPSFGYPTKYSFIEWTKKLIDNVNSRFPHAKVSNLPYKESIYSITIFESIVAFKIYPSKCYESVPVSNDGIFANAEDFRYKDSATQGKVVRFMYKTAKRFPALTRIPAIKVLSNILISRYAAYIQKRRLNRLGNFF
ncbi:class I SAM-dependent methyltransferase [Methylotenera sp.]|uniref:class I SAM-dependent methyltransferase n=1 Tax=Methylotenera sp. TaxID=2051956 RepID=UPI002731DB9A|nr:class I SAM-dependent methyltransferase [Methylotenera sp.]MDP2231499.1 class I SAM-dependent methyltransferase [Methylotenera sp.]